MESGAPVPGRGKAIASLVLGIVADVFLFITPWVSLVTGLVGLVLACVSKRDGFTGGIRTAGFVAMPANCNPTAPHLVSRGAFWYRVGCILAQVGCIFRGRGASQNYLDYSAIWSDYYSKIRAWRFYG